jgi:hypothetical protein
VDNCGHCGVKCPTAPHSLRKCEKGRCDICCDDKEWRNCDGKTTNGCETNVHVNLHHCGKCANVCTAPQNATATCSRGICGFECAKGFQKCQNKCSPEQHINTVGSCGSTRQVCPNRPNSDPTCSGAGTCGFTCHPGFGDCDGNPINGCEADLRIDGSNCGACNSTCSASQSCSNSACVCSPGFANCDGNPINGCETDLRTDMNNCGACNASCVVVDNADGSSSTCSNSTCSVQCIDSSFGNCDGIVSNGCEVFLNDYNNCGACNSTCSDSQSCSNSACVCNPGFANCDGNPINGCETDLRIDGSNCGACNSTCSASQSCSNSACVCNPNFADCDGDPSNGCETDLRTDMYHCNICNNSCYAACNDDIHATCSDSNCFC